MPAVNAATRVAKYNRRQLKEQAIELASYLALEAEADELSKVKCAQRDTVLSLVDHGDSVSCVIDGITYSRLAVNEVLATNQHKKVVAALAKDYGIDPDTLATYYEETAGSKHDRDLKKF